MLNEMFYQVGLIDAAGRGLNQQLREAILAAAGDRGSALAEAFRFFEDDEVTGMRDNGPRLSVYFGGPGYRKDLDTVVENQLTAGNLVIPVVPELVGFHSQVPASLAATNGMALPPGGDLAALVSLILEDFRLLRSSRRVFVSYKRTESQAAATGLYHELDANSFDAFLDTHSIRQGDPFQERLWHRMADSDVIVLLNTATVLTSGWVAQELDRADAMGISVLQVLWPGIERDPRTRMFEPIYLEPDDFESSSSAAGSSLTAAAMARLLTAVERLRARALASREARLLKVLCGMASERGIAFSVPRPGCVDFCAGTPQLKRVFLGVGIPDGPTYHDAVETPSEQVPERVWLMYDTLPIAPFHQRYLDWLGPMLPVGTLKLAGVEDFLSGLGCP
jgi:hypothetical protein